MQIWRIILVYGVNHRTRDLGYIYMNWEYPPLAGELLRLVGRYTIYVHIKEANE